jgi:hypothetical protein
MKKLIATAALILGMAAGYPQGQVNFNNKVATSGINARVIDEKTGTGAVSPPDAAGLAVDAGGTLIYIPGSATTFRSSPAAASGYINPLVVTVPGHDISASITLRMFGYVGPATDAVASDLLRSRSWVSNPVTVTLGGGTLLPPDMVGLQGFVINLPEPSATALALLGAAALFIRRRK